MASKRFFRRILVLIRKYCFSQCVAYYSQAIHACPRPFSEMCWRDTEGCKYESLRVHWLEANCNVRTTSRRALHVFLSSLTTDCSAKVKTLLVISGRAVGEDLRKGVICDILLLDFSSWRGCQLYQRSRQVTRTGLQAAKSVSPTGLNFTAFLTHQQ